MFEWFKAYASFETIAILMSVIGFSAVLLWDDKPGINRLFKKKTK